MKRTIVIEPLHDEYEEVFIRTTNLEKMMDCPYRFKHWEYIESKQQTFGKLAHTVLQTFLFNKETTREFIFEHYIPLAEWDDAKLLREYVNLAEEIPGIVAAEVTVEIHVEYWATLYIVSWHIDAVHTMTHIGDFKTSKTEWKIEDLVGKLQPYIYWYGLWWPEWMWTYWIFTKHKRGARLQTDMQFTITEQQAENKIRDIIKIYHHFRTNEYPKRRNKYCYWCQFKDTCEVLNSDLP